MGVDRTQSLHMLGRHLITITPSPKTFYMLQKKSGKEIECKQSRDTKD
jgi:hypothetical protein